MKYPRYVKVSPDAPDSWWDPKAQKWFTKKGDNGDGLIELVDDLDATNIVRYIRFNYLFDATHIKNPPVVAQEELKPVIEKTPNQLLKEVEAEAKTVVVNEEITEEKAEVVIEEKPVAKDGKEVCPYCKGEYSAKGIATHKKSCKKNPDNQ
jgi:uncharacterized protein with PIN domain